MYNQSDYDKQQRDLFKKASCLAANGEECNHLVQYLDPEYTLRLRAFIRDLPEEIRTKSTFGRVNPPVYQKKKK